MRLSPAPRRGLREAGKPQQQQQRQQHAPALPASDGEVSPAQASDSLARLRDMTIAAAANGAMASAKAGPALPWAEEGGGGTCPAGALYPSASAR